MAHVLAISDHPLHALGNLRPTAFLHDSNQLHEGETVINGVALSHQVIEELRQLGIALSWYSSGELQDAVAAVHHDGQLIDDPNGMHFRDKLHHSEEEKDADNLSWYQHARMRLRIRKRKVPHPHEECTHNLQPYAAPDRESAMLHAM